MARILYPDGREQYVAPANGRDFSLEELKSHIGGGYIEIVNLNENCLMIVDEDGKRKESDVNPVATEVAHLNKAISRRDCIVGAALICLKKEVK